MFEQKYETIDIEIDSELLKQLREILDPMGLTPELLAAQFIEWCVNPATQEEAFSLLLKWQREAQVP